MAHKNIGDYIAMVEEGLAGLKQLTNHEPAASMDDEAGEYDVVPTRRGRGRMNKSSFKFAKKDETEDK